LPPLPVCEINVPDKIKSSCEDPLGLELEDLPSHLEYAFLEGADYPADGDDDDDEDEDEDEDKEEEEEEHPALADSVPPVHRMTARISIWD
ncbi:hypothetical protein Tco_0387718, partial [Tanacetum coccineum]